MTARNKVVFTIEDANRTLPLVRSIVGDVADRWSDLVRVREEYGNSSPEHDRIMRELAEYIQELKAIGCHLKDFEKGLVDFPAVIKGKEVFLSWQLGEEEISFMTDGEGESSSRVRLPGFQARRAIHPRTRLPLGWLVAWRPARSRTAHPWLQGASAPDAVTPPIAGRTALSGEVRCISSRARRPTARYFTGRQRDAVIQTVLRDRHDRLGGTRLETVAA